MLEFCKCGSLITNGQCTNKNCPSKVSEKTGPAALKQTKSIKTKEEKKPRARRASKVITYNLYDTEEEEQN